MPSLSTLRGSAVGSGLPSSRFEMDVTVQGETVRISVTIARNEMPARLRMWPTLVREFARPAGEPPSPTGSPAPAVGPSWDATDAGWWLESHGPLPPQRRPTGSGTPATPRTGSRASIGRIPLFDFYLQAARQLFYPVTPATIQQLACLPHTSLHVDLPLLGDDIWNNEDWSWFPRTRALPAVAKADLLWLQAGLLGKPFDPFGFLDITKPRTPSSSKHRPGDSAISSVKSLSDPEDESSIPSGNIFVRTVALSDPFVDSRSPPNSNIGGSSSHKKKELKLFKPRSLNIDYNSLDCPLEPNIPQSPCHFDPSTVLAGANSQLKQLYTSSRNAPIDTPTPHAVSCGETSLPIFSANTNDPQAAPITISHLTSPFANAFSDSLEAVIAGKFFEGLRHRLIDQEKMAPQPKQDAAQAKPTPRIDTSNVNVSSNTSANGDAISAAQIGPHPGNLSIPQQYNFEQMVRLQQKQNGCDPLREDNYRVLGVQLIDNIRESLRLPVRTFTTACTYYHKFRLSFRDAEYNYQDAATASLFVACKVEDTIKKSREIMCAAYNVKNPDHRTSTDSQNFDQLSKIVIGLERLILETIGFDFRGRYPQKILAKVVKDLIGASEGPTFFAVAWDISIDMYKTFSPIKQTTFAMTMAIVELTALLTNTHVTEVKAVDLAKYNTCRSCVVETMLDLLELYTHHQHHKSTKIGQRIDLQTFLDIKIVLNEEVEKDASLSRYQKWCEGCHADEARSTAAAGENSNGVNGTTTPHAGSAKSPNTAGSGPTSAATVPGTAFPGSNSVRRSARGENNTLRFMFDAEQARKETDTINKYFKEEFEECEIEVEESIPDSAADHKSHSGQHRQGPTGPRRDNRNHGFDGNWQQGGGGHPRHHRNNHHDRHGGGGRGRKYY